uniref:Stabilizer of axonemal microtubules 2 n=1 Tax=Aotus nancymaae TaxID=37293 RepID=A0A2K5DCQ3_AOTNA
VGGKSMRSWCLCQICTCGTGLTREPLPLPQ